MVFLYPIFVIGYLLTYLTNVYAVCIQMPTEIRHRWLSSDCWNNGFIEEIICPYELPYLHYNLKQVVPFAGRSSSTVLCQSTKVCCSFVSVNSLPENKDRLKELLHENEVLLSNINNSSLINLKELNKKIIEIKNILDPVPNSENKVKEKYNYEYEYIVFLITLISAIFVWILFFN